MKKGNKKNQHYIPQFYLRNFSSNDKNIGMYRFNGKLFVEKASIRSVAYRKYLYGEDGALENILSKLETNWSKIIKKIINDESIMLSKSEYLILLQFIVVSEARTAKLAEDYSNFYNTLIGVNNELRIEHGITKKDIYNEAFNFMKNEPNAYAIYESIENGSKYLYSLKPVLLINTTRYDFITCDNPIIKYNQLYMYRNYLNNYGWGTAGIQMFLIINPKIVLCLYDPFVYKCRKNNENIKIIAKNQVMEINKLAVNNAYESLFFNQIKREDLEEIIKNKQIINPQKATQIFKNDKDRILLGFGVNSIKRNIKLGLFEIKDKYKNISLPLHMGGLEREDISMVKALTHLTENEFI